MKKIINFFNENKWICWVGAICFVWIFLLTITFFIKNTEPHINHIDRLEREIGKLKYQNQDLFFEISQLEKKHQELYYQINNIEKWDNQDLKDAIIKLRYKLNNIENFTDDSVLETIYDFQYHFLLKLFLYPAFLDRVLKSEKE